MIFRQWQQVLDGTKTQTRRLAKENEYGWVRGHRERADGHISMRYSDVYSRTDANAVTEKHRQKWAVGLDYAVQLGRGKKAVGRIKITEIRRERLQKISAYDAIAEGCGPGRTLILPPGVLEEFAIKSYASLWRSINSKKGTRWEDNPEVWVLTFERLGT